MIPYLLFKDVARKNWGGFYLGEGNSIDCGHSFYKFYAFITGTGSFGRGWTRKPPLNTPMLLFCKQLWIRHWWKCNVRLCWMSTRWHGSIHTSLLIVINQCNAFFDQVSSILFMLQQLNSPAENDQYYYHFYVGQRAKIPVSLVKYRTTGNPKLLFYSISVAQLGLRLPTIAVVIYQNA